MRTPLVGSLLLVSLAGGSGLLGQEPDPPPARSASASEATAAASRPESVEDLIRRRLGLRFSILGSKIRRSIISTDTPYGFSVRRVYPDSPAEKSGVESSVVVLEVDGKPFREIRELGEILRAKKSGESVELRCARRKKRRRLFDRKPWENVVLKLKLTTPVRRASPRKPRRRII